ncbi:YdeI/OmpD-associated family protein [Lacibacter sp. H375]|uniref:YdeI/OmpD-associated family protein n=1 Tax=Lacibacter sp. H375 TaxID=3133424 RepID=UPI0030BC6E06
MKQFTAVVQKYKTMGEKTGWTFIEIPDGIPEQLKPGHKKEFKVKGKLDDYTFKQMPLYPVGGGKFIMALNADVRKAIGKRQGATVHVKISADNSAFQFNHDLMECLNDEPAALQHFKSLTGSHQRYFSKWIDSAKTEPTKAKRIAMAVTALARKMGYPEMIREETAKNKLLR